MRQWHSMLEHVWQAGESRPDRTGTGRRSVFGFSTQFDLRDGFPAVTTKRLAFGQVQAELACFLGAVETLEEFHGLGCTIWDANAARWRDGSVVGRHYGVQWRRWRAEGRADLDQLREAVRLVRHDPDSRRIMVAAWNPGELGDSCLPPCHTHFQLYPSADGRWLDCAVYMRSCDAFLGLPFDVASYALLLALLCNETGRSPRRLLFFFGDLHVYADHAEPVAEVLSRDPRGLPLLRLPSAAGLDSFRPGDASLAGYDPHPAVPARMAA